MLLFLYTGVHGTDAGFNNCVSKNIRNEIDELGNDSIVAGGDRAFPEILARVEVVGVGVE